MKVGLLLSGGLGLNALQLLANKKDLRFVMTNKLSTEIISFCEIHKIPCFVGNPRNGVASGFLADKDVDVIFSINYLFLIEKDIINVPRLYCINIHGSLLPKYRGRTPHVWSIINNEEYTGVTAHLIDENCDTGCIIKQKKIKIDDDDTGATILNKYEPIYLSLINELITDIESGSIQFVKQDEDKATTFGKRTPDDGLICWNWHKERIKNWVRAQAHPYPGAFVLVDNKKVIIDKVVYSDFGFNQDMENGLVLNLNPPLIKTPNGVLELKIVREGLELLKKGMIL